LPFAQRGEDNGITITSDTIDGDIIQHFASIVSEYAIWDIGMNFLLS
jgi:hypothetical protein